MRSEACTATHVHREQSPQLLDLRIACLDGRVAELIAFVTALETADRESVRRSIDAADRLPALAACADGAPLAAPIAPPHPAIAKRVDAIAGQLAQAAALDHAETGIAHYNVGDVLLGLDRPRDAIPPLRKALAILERTLPSKHPHVVTAMTALGDALLRTGDRQSAIPMLERAIESTTQASELARARTLLARASARHR